MFYEHYEDVSNLVLIIEKFRELRNGSSGQLSIILVINEVDHSMLEHLGRFGQPLHVGGVGGVKLGRSDLHALVESLGKHGSADALGTSHGVLPIHFYKGKS